MKVAKRTLKAENTADASGAVASTSVPVKRALSSSRKKKEGDPDALSSAVKVNRIPFGFFESELLKYFTQFGRIRRVRVARSKKTGNHKGWAFVQFLDTDVARIAAETMNNYLMFNKLIQCRVLKNSEVPKCLLKGKTLMGRPSKYATARRHTKIASAEKSDAKVKAAESRLRSRLEKRNEQLAAMGLDYSFGIEPPAKSHPIKEEDLADDKRKAKKKVQKQKNLKTEDSPKEPARKKKKSLEQK